MIKVGLTGGIGTGKSTVAEIFKLLGVPVYNADYRARLLTNTHTEIISSVKALFGNDIYTENGLDRKKVASLVFKDKPLLAQLNNIIHPAVANDFEQWLEKNMNSPYIIKEAAILFESGGNKQVDKVICVAAPEELRIKRVMKRDGVSKEEVQSRINNQMKEEDKQKMADFLIHCNDEDLVIPQVVALHQSLVSLAKMIK